MALLKNFLVIIFFIVAIISFSHSDQEYYKTLPENNVIHNKREINQKESEKLGKFNEIVDVEKRQVVFGKYFKWKMPIPYKFEGTVNRQLMFHVLLTIQLQTCITFVLTPTIPDKRLGIVFKQTKNCEKVSIRQTINSWQTVYFNEKCMRSGHIYREVFHLLGMVYEHQRECRDKFVHIIPENFARFSASNFIKLPNDDFSKLATPYDYGSIMHPDKFFFADNGKKTILPVYPFYKKTMGQLKYPSFNDFKRINYYFCAKKCTKKMKCYHGGYQDPHLCVVCKCVPGFSGIRCERFRRPSLKCHQTVNDATFKYRTLKNSGIKNCSYIIRAPKARHVEVKVLYANIYPKEKICNPYNSLEIKFLPDKTTTGIRLCGVNSEFRIISMDTVMILYFNSMDPNNKFLLQYKLH